MWANVPGSLNRGAQDDKVTSVAVVTRRREAAEGRRILGQVLDFVWEGGLDGGVVGCVRGL